MKLTMKTYLHWYAHINVDLNNGLRMGQSFCNQFCINDNALFYSNNPEEIHEMIQKVLIEEKIV